MISRTYVCLLPNSAGVNLDIAVETAPGTSAAPVGTGGVAASAAAGAYYELRGRPIRFPVRAGTPGFVARARLGWRLSIYKYGASALALPGVLLSASIVNTLDSTDNPVTMNLTNLADPGYGPTIRLLNVDGQEGTFYIVHFDLMEAKDEDRSPTGAV